MRDIDLEITIFAALIGIVILSGIVFSSIAAYSSFTLQSYKIECIGNGGIWSENHNVGCSYPHG